MSTSARKLARRSALPPLVPKTHTDFGELGIMWYDEELDLAAGPPHSKTAHYFGDMLLRIAEESGYGFLSDNPIWYWDQGKQKAFYADLALAETNDPDVIDKVTADNLLLACEVVTTTHAAKLKKDTEIQYARNEIHGVPEFLLLYPDMDDARILEWFTLIDGRYHLMQPHEGRYASRAVPGLVIEPLAREAWQWGRKFRVFYKNRMFRPGLEEFMRAEEKSRDNERLREQLEISISRANRQHTRANRAESEADKARTEADKARTEADKARAEADEERQRRLVLEKKLADLERGESPQG